MGHHHIESQKQVVRFLPYRTKIIDIFDNVDQALLILGEQGSGKTTVMLDLTRDLIERAEQNHAMPIPVVFSLSTWGNDQQTIQDWIIEELLAIYNIPERIGRKWNTL